MQGMFQRNQASVLSFWKLVEAKAPLVDCIRGDWRDFTADPRLLVAYQNQAA
jgi:hypothetical protein